MTKRADHHREPSEQTRGQVHKLHRVNLLQARDHLVGRQPPHRRHTREPEDDTRRIDQGQNRSTGWRGDPRIRTIREHQREVEEQRRQHHGRHRIGPVEEIIRSREFSGVGECKHAEECRRQPEKMHRRRIGRTTQTHGCADEQSEDADRGKQVVQDRLRPWCSRQLERQQGVSGIALNGVGDDLSGFHRAQPRGDIFRRVHHVAANCLQYVASAKARISGRGTAAHFKRAQVGAPEHSVIYGRPVLPVLDDHQIDQRERDQARSHSDRDNDADERIQGADRGRHC